MLGKETALNSEGFHLLYPLPLRESETHLTAVDVGTGWAHENITFFFFFFYLSAILGGTFLLLLFLSISLLEISKHFLKHFFFFFLMSVIGLEGKDWWD